MGARSVSLYLSLQVFSIHTPAEPPANTGVCDSKYVCVFVPITQLLSCLEAKNGPRIQNKHRCGVGERDIDQLQMTTKNKLFFCF